MTSMPLVGVTLMSVEFAKMSHIGSKREGNYCPGQSVAAIKMKGGERRGF